ncbi:type II toxin-antitoxin system VapC family toxin [Ideonella azotifigens]|uniref:PIN domain-containing protein n=1 Tax=Ideonella azotifigens TaxID=513160 RepID=A0ABN1KLK7_9BURK|nr:type II toxin-antitoxin system VapC family toxin [Ideonella azotifigens]MCD2343343.1 type II toxin-antitoxin system VapC family toxin [Ideonella azotifigens]
MSVAINTNVLVRLLVRDDEVQFAAALRLVTAEAAAGTPVLILLCTLLETEWVLRSRMKLDRVVIADVFVKLLESTDFSFEHVPTVEEALYLWSHHASADFANCLQKARAAQLGRLQFMTFDVGASKLPGALLLR